ncbi:glycosyltransferase [Candidatus Kaiserbacteria bacterium]|nr:glycosyltransferase [Candidatus Kaiserbacteria bacterium]
MANTADRTADAIAKRGHVVRVFTVSKVPRDELRRISKGRYDVETIPSVGLPIYLGVRATVPVGLALRKTARFVPDIIHSHTPFSMGWEAVWAARFLKVPLVGTHHTFFDHYLKHVHLDYAWARRLSWKLTVGYYNRCDLVISPTKSLADELVKHGLWRPRQIVPNIVDSELFHLAKGVPALKQRLGLSEKVVVHMGRLSYEKSVDRVLHAFVQVFKREPRATLIIVGDGPDKNALEVLAKNLGLSECVRFTGFIHGSTLVEYIQAADVFLTASKSENMPLAVLEAMACGLPIVAVRSLGLSEIVEDGKNGYLVPPDDVLAMAEHGRELLRDDELRARFSASSHALSEKYAESAVAEQLERLYQLTIDKHLHA